MNEQIDSTINQRLSLLVDTFERGSKSAFASKIGVTVQSVHDLIGGRKGTPSFKLLSSILENYPTVDANWLVLGHGPMLLKGRSDTDTGRPLALESSEQLIDLIRAEVAEQMASIRPYEEVYKLLNDEQSQRKAEYLLSWQEDAEMLREKLNALDNTQASTASELARRLEEVERAINVLSNLKASPNGLMPSIAYRVEAKPDYSKPFDGLLSRRLNISEAEAKRLVEEHETGSTSMDGYGYEVSEALVRKFLRRQTHRLK